MCACMSLLCSKSRRILCSVYTLHRRINRRSWRIIKHRLVKHYSPPGCQTVHCRLQPWQTTLVVAACPPLLSIKLHTTLCQQSAHTAGARPCSSSNWMCCCYVEGVVFTPPLFSLTPVLLSPCVHGPRLIVRSAKNCPLACYRSLVYETIMAHKMVILKLILERWVLRWCILMLCTGGWAESAVSRHGRSCCPWQLSP